MIEMSEGFVAGTPTEVAEALVHFHHDTLSGIMVKLIDSWNRDHHASDPQNDPWDYGPQLYTIYRSLPPTELADKLQGIGYTAAVLGMVPVPLPDGVNTDRGPHIADCLNTLAEGMREDPANAAEAITISEKNSHAELVGWMLMVEAWASKHEGVADDPSQLPGGENFVMPTADPERVECRIVYAVDRARFQYQLIHERVSNEVSMMVMTGKNADNMVGAFGRIPEAMMAVMDATPEGDP